MAIKTKRLAVATAFSLDWQDIEYYRYHYGRTNVPVYAFEDSYVCATKKEKPPMGWNWEKYDCPEVEKYGFTIYTAKVVDKVIN